MPWRRRLIASTRSSRSVVRVVCWACDLVELFLGAQVDGAQPLALAPQPLEPLLDLGGLGQLGARLELGQLRHRLRRHLQHLADLAGDVGEPPLGALEPLLGARRLLARGAGRLERGAGVAIGGRQRILGLGEAIGGGPARRFRRLDLADQRHALLGEGLRGVGEARALGLGLLHAAFERGDLGGGAVAALGPAGALAGDRLQPALRQLGLARERLRLRAQLGEPGAALLDLGAHARELALHLGRRRQRLEHALGLAGGRHGLVAARVEPRLGFGQRRQPGGVASDLALAGGMQLARGERRVLALAPVRSRGRLGLRRRPSPRPRPQPRPRA